MDTELARFAADLADLRRAAGDLSYRSMARMTNYSRTILAQAAGGRIMPSLAVTLAFVRACGGDTGWWESRWHKLRGTSAAAPTVAPAWPRVPVADGAEPDAAGCSAEAVTAYARKVALDGRRIILGHVELRHSRRDHAAWARFEGYASLDTLARRPAPVEIALQIERRPDAKLIEFTEEYVSDFHWTELLVVRTGQLFQARVEIRFDGVRAAAAETDWTELS